MALHVLRHDADRTVSSAWPSRYATLATSWVPDACHLDGMIDAPGQAGNARRDGKRAWCQARPARRRVHAHP
eukprot:571919-Prymnesium_polylepis.1